MQSSNTPSPSSLLAVGLFAVMVVSPLWTAAALALTPQVGWPAASDCAPGATAARMAPPAMLRTVSDAKGIGSPDPAAKACVIMTTSCNSTVVSELTTDDCTLDDGTLIDFWEFQGVEGQEVTIDLMSDDFDTFLFLIDPTPVTVAFDDDGGAGTNSRIVFTLGTSGTWTIGANAFFLDDMGDYTLSLACGDPPATVVINEILQDPDQVADSAGEWFKLFNNTAGAVDINGWTIQDNDTDSHVITNGAPLVVLPGGFLVLARNGDSGTNGGVTADYVYGGSITLANTSDELVLLDGSLAEVDRVEWDDGATFPEPTGASMELARDRLANNHLGENWCEAVIPFGDGDLGTPGTANDCVRGTYYSSVDLTDLTTARQTIHDVIDDHNRTPLTSPDSWLILELADEDPNNPANILDVYKNASYTKVGGGTGPYNREHTWPDSYGFPVNSGTGLYPRSDYHGLFLSDSGYNSSRSNLPFDYCPSCSEPATDANNGQGGTSMGEYPGDSNWRTGSGPTGSWETWTGDLGGRRGDVARAVLYMDVRYDGSDHSGGSEEPDLILTDDRDLIVSDNTNPQDPAYMGILSTLLAWHDQDPPDDVERDRNEVVAAAQGNRNPFIDHPEWVACVFVEPCGIFADGFESGDTSVWSFSVP